MVEISEDLHTWNPCLDKVIVPRMEGKLIHACDQILKCPALRANRPGDCMFVDRILTGGGIPMFRKGRSLQNSLKLILFKYFPKVYLLKSQFLSMIKFDVGGGM